MLISTQTQQRLDSVFRRAIAAVVESHDGPESLTMAEAEERAMEIFETAVVCYERPVVDVPVIVLMDDEEEERQDNDCDSNS